MKHGELHQSSSTEHFDVVVFLDHLENSLRMRLNDKEQSEVHLWLDQLAARIST